MTFIKIVEVILGASGALALFWAGFKNNLSGSTVKLLSENKQAQDAAIKRLEDAANTQAVQIAELTGQVKLLKDIPLAQIAKSLEVVMTSHTAIEKLLNTREEVAHQIADEAASKVIQFLAEKDKQ